MFQFSPDDFHMEPQHHSHFRADFNNMPQGQAQIPEPEGYGIDYNPEQMQRIYGGNDRGYEGVVGGYDVPHATPFGGYEVPHVQPRQVSHSARFVAQEYASLYTGYGLPGNAAHSAPIGQVAYATNQVPMSDTTFSDTQRPVQYVPHYPACSYPLPLQPVYRPQSSTRPVLDPRQRQLLVPAAAQESAPLPVFAGASHFSDHQTPSLQSSCATQSGRYQPPQDRGIYTGHYLPQTVAPSAGGPSFGHPTYAQNSFVISETPIQNSQQPIQHASYVPGSPRVLSPQLNHGPQTWTGPAVYPQPSPLSHPAASQTHTPATASALFSPAGTISSTSTTPIERFQESTADASTATTPEPIWDLEALPILFKDEVPGHPGWKAIPRLVPQVCRLAGNCGLAGDDLPTEKGSWAAHIRQKHGGAAEPVQRCSWPDCTTTEPMSLANLGRHVSEHHLGQHDMLCLWCYFRDWCTACIMIDDHGALSVPVEHSITRNDPSTRKRHAGPCMRRPLVR